MSGQLNILCIETSGGYGSVALGSAGSILCREIPTPRSQAEELVAHIDALLAEAGIGLRQLDAIGVGYGPGSFIGVRLAVSVAQGLASAVGIGLAPVSSMAALAGQVLCRGVPATPRRTPVIVCLDARMGEIYWAEFAADASREVPSTDAAERLVSPTDVVWSRRGPGIAAGSGFAAYPQLAQAAAERGHIVEPTAEPRAEDLLPFAREAIDTGALVAPEAWRIPYLRDESAWRTLPGERL